MSVQRRRGRPVRVYKQIEVEDARGNKVKVPDPNNPYEVTAAAIPQRSSKAEVPGQRAIDVTRLIIDPLEDVGMWSRVEFDGQEWDIAAPPAMHWGTRRTRHWSVDVRARGPMGGG